MPARSPDLAGSTRFSVGSGDPTGTELVIRANAKLEEKVELAKRLTGIKEDMAEPEKKKWRTRFLCPPGPLT